MESIAFDTKTPILASSTASGGSGTGGEVVTNDAGTICCALCSFASTCQKVELLGTPGFGWGIKIFSVYTYAQWDIL